MSLQRRPGEAISEAQIALSYLIAFFVLIGLYITLDMVFNFDELTEIRWDVRPSPHLGTLENRICDGLHRTLQLRINRANYAAMRPFLHGNVAVAREVGDFLKERM